MDNSQVKQKAILNVVYLSWQRNLQNNLDFLLKTKMHNNLDILLKTKIVNNIEKVKSNNYQ